MSTPDRPSDEGHSHFAGFLHRLGEHSPKTSRYTLKGEVARGGMGVILRVYDEDLRRDLAMKVVLGKTPVEDEDGTSTIDPVTLGRFLDEAQVTGMLDHPGIVPVHELGVDDEGRVYFTMRLVKGRDLKAVFQAARDSEDGWNRTRVLGVLLKACEAIAYAHDHGVVHRDLKPANIMVGRYGEVYVMDWGLARVEGCKDARDLRLQPDKSTSLKSLHTVRRDEAEDTPGSPLLTMDGAIMGTPDYMSPEQARGDVEGIGPRTDVYQMGVMLYELLTGRTPFNPPDARRSARMVVLAVQEETPKPVHVLAPDAPAELAAICERAMARDAANRYADVTELASDLRAFLEGRVVRAYETGAVAELRKWVARNKALAAALAAAFVLALAGGSAFAWLNERASRLATDLSVRQLELESALAVAQEQRDLAQTNEEQAKANAEIAEANATRAAYERANVLRLSAFQELEELQREAMALWPATPDLLPAYDAWLTHAAELVAGLDSGPSHRFVLHTRQEWLSPQSEEEREEERRSWRLSDIGDVGDVGDRWWVNQLTKLIDEIEAFADPKTGLIDGISKEHGWGVARRLAFASSPEQQKLVGPEADRRWAEAIASISDSAQCPAYGGLVLTRQRGLLPIGRDPDSGLWEFWHGPSGDEPLRGEDGNLVLNGSTGIVLVLIPGRTFWMGAQKTDPAGQNYDPQAHADQSPVHEVTLWAYLLSKYEMTQSQWTKITGSNPSLYAEKADAALLPVESVSWDMCRDVLPRLGLDLPTEAQWECAARGGTQTLWSCDEDELSRAANLGSRPTPVGSLEPNSFGLHDVHGNVWEWCLDTHTTYRDEPQVDPVTVDPGARNRVIRGGSFYSGGLHARSAYRFFFEPGVRDLSPLGLRPAKGIAP